MSPPFFLWYTVYSILELNILISSREVVALLFLLLLWQNTTRSYRESFPKNENTVIIFLIFVVNLYDFLFMFNRRKSYRFEQHEGE